MPLDIGIGILLALGVAELTGTHATPALIAFGIASALLPDIDILTIPLFKKWYHRTHTHFPIIYVPLAMLAFVFLPLPWALLFTLGVYAHLIHDTFGIGWGIAWLWPFSKRKFLFLAPKRNLPPQGMNWMTYYYLRPNPLAYLEYGALLIALVTLFLYYG
jgi:hypothetical protein